MALSQAKLIQGCSLLAVLLLAVSPSGLLSAQAVPQAAPPAAPPAAASERTGLSAETGPADVRLAPVSIDPEKVLEILRVQPGLVLEIKKILIRKAYERGRFLDPQELTDDALFGLITTDENIRAIATREIAARGYLNLRPTKAELDQREREKLSKDLQRQVLMKEVDQAAVERAKAGQEQSDLAKQAAAAREQRRVQDNVPFRETTTPAVPMERVRPQDLPGVLSASDMSPYGQQMGQSEQLYSGIPGSGKYDVGDIAPYDTASRPAEVDVGTATPREPRSAPRPATTPRARASDVKRQPSPYANVPSLYDLYAQAAQGPRRLERFGSAIFQNGTSNFDDLPMDVPAGPDYVLGPGDGVKIDLWGGVNQRLTRVVDREGRISLPEAGTVLAAGRSLGDVQREVQAVLRTQFRDVKADVSLARIRSLRVYVVGDVTQPGPYDVSSLSTPLNAVYAAGGPTPQGSLRTIRHYRGKQLVQEVDVYDLILRGVRSDVAHLQSGDTIQVPPTGPEVTVAGMVRRPAIYELRGEQSLADVLAMAGGVLSTGTLRHIDVERVEAHQRRTMLSLDVPESNDQQAVDKTLAEFKVQDGDKVHIAPILPYSEKTVYLDGHVFRPGKYPFREGMKLTDLIKSYKELLPEPSRRHAEIIRLKPPDYTPVVLAFNLGDALEGKDPPPLMPFDTVRVFGRYDFEDPPEIMVTGEVRDPGEHLTNGETHVRDAVYLAGGLKSDALLSEAQVYRRVNGSELKVISVNLEKALAGDAANNVLIEPKDRLIVHRNLAKMDPATVAIHGEVGDPGKYPLGDGMTAAQLVRVAGGLKRSAYTSSADLFRYVIQNGRKVLGEHIEVPIGKALAGEPDTDVRLYDGDILTIRPLSGWSEIGASVTVAGEVAYPGTYGISDGERLSSLLKRAGGFRAGAYPYGVVLERVQVRELSEKSRQELIHRIEAGESFGAASLSAGAGSEQLALVQGARAQQQQVLASLKSQPATGRMVVKISFDIKSWEGTTTDVEVRAGDTLFIPKRPNFVLVVGQINSTSAITYSPGKNAGWYLQQAGGTTNLAEKKAIFVVRADGSVIGNSGRGWWSGGILGLRLQPGDTMVVPAKIIGGSMFWKNMLNTAQIASSLAIAARVATSF